MTYGTAFYDGSNYPEYPSNHTASLSCLITLDTSVKLHHNIITWMDLSNCHWFCSSIVPLLQWCHGCVCI